MSSSSRQKAAAGSSSSQSRSDDPGWMVKIKLKQHHVLGSFIKISTQDCDQIFGGNVAKIVPKEGRVINMSDVDDIQKIYSMYLQVEVDGFDGHYTLGRNCTNKTIIEELRLREGSEIGLHRLSSTSTEIGLKPKEESPVPEMRFKVLEK